MRQPDEPMGSDAALSVRAWLVSLVLVCTIPLLVIASVYLGHQYLVTRERLLDDALSTTRALTAVVDRELARHEAALLSLASSPLLHTDDLGGFAAQAAQVQTDLGLTSIVLVGPDHRQVVNTLLPWGSELPREENPPLHAIFESRRPVVSDLFMAPVAKRLLVAVGVPVMRHGEVVYVLGAGVSTERLSDVLSQQRLPGDWVAAIFDGTGTIVARTHEMTLYQGHKGAPELLQALLRENEGSLETTTLEGIPVFSVFTRSEVSHWSVAIGIPRAAVRERFQGTLLVLAAITVALLGAGWSAAWLLGRILRRSIRSLIPPALALGRGEPVSVPRLPVSEANELGAALNRTSHLLQRAIEKARQDSLTGLANRTLFEEFADHHLAQCLRDGSTMAILYVDLDGFKEINDRYGHTVGDALLRSTADRMANVLRRSDLLARLGGDEFAAILPNTGREGALNVGANVLAAVRVPWQFEHDKEVTLSASIGIAVYPGFGSTLSTLLHQADSAMYAAKAMGKNRVVAWSSPEDTAVRAGQGAASSS